MPGDRPPNWPKSPDPRVDTDYLISGAFAQFPWFDRADCESFVVRTAFPGLFSPFAPLFVTWLRKHDDYGEFEIWVQRLDLTGVKMCSLRLIDSHDDFPASPQIMIGEAFDWSSWFGGDRGSEVILLGTKPNGVWSWEVWNNNPGQPQFLGARFQVEPIACWIPTPPWVP